MPITLRGSWLIRHIGGSAFAHIRRIPAPVALLAVSAPLCLLVALAVAAVAPVERERIALALPADGAPPAWDERVGEFSERLQQAFGLDAARAREFSDWILEASMRQELPPELVASLIYTESSFRKRARSWAGAVGPAQVKPGIWRRFCNVDLRDPESNVYCGAQILAHYVDRCGDHACALQLYNVGPGNMRDPHFRRASNRYLTKVEDTRSLLVDTTAVGGAM